MKSTASAAWQGGLKDGKGTVSAANGAFTDVAYNYVKRFEGAAGPGTTPEELIAAAHASCFSMAFANELAKAGHPPTNVATQAVVTLQPVDGKPTVVSSHLTTRASVPGIDSIFIGPSDLSASMGHLGDIMHAEVQAKLRDAAQQCRSLGKPVGIIGANPELVARYVEYGYNWIAIGSDMGFMLSRGQEWLATARGLAPSASKPSAY